MSEVHGAADGDREKDTDTRPVPTDVGAPPDDASRDALASLLDVLDLRPDGDDAFVGPSQPQPWGRVFGGQVLAQTVAAAQRTVDVDRPVHSMHGYFLRAGDPAEPISFTVERLRDGRSFSARRVHAIQKGRPILSMIASFVAGSPGLDHAEPMPEGLPGPEDVPTVAQRYARYADNPAVRYWLRQRPVDLRHVEDPMYVEAGTDRSSRMHVWMRTVGALPDDPALHAAVLAYASDYCLLEPVRHRHGVTMMNPGLRIASLDHAMWWHRPFRADEWLLYVLDSPSAQDSRGLGTGRIYTRDGVLVASTAQEGMIRLPRP